MADSSSNKCSEVDDLEEQLSRSSITDELKLPGDKQGAVNNNKEDEQQKKKKKKKKKMKRCRMHPDDVEMMLSYELGDMPSTKNIDRAAKEKGGVYKDMSSKISMLQAWVLDYDETFRAIQEKIRHELLTKGYATCWATDDEEDEENQQAVGGQRKHEEDEEDEQGARGRTEQV